jgi:hypothetical protein
MLSENLVIDTKSNFKVFLSLRNPIQIWGAETEFSDWDDWSIGG